MKGLCEGILVKLQGHNFPPLLFLPNWEEKNCGSGREIFLPGFSPLKPLLFSIQCQTKENPLFHSIFLPIFFTPPKIHPTKHIVNFAHAHKAVSTLLHNWFGFGLAVIDCWQKLVCFGPLLLVQYIVIQIGAHMNLRIIWMAKKVG